MSPISDYIAGAVIVAMVIWSFGLGHFVRTEGYRFVPVSFVQPSLN